MKRERKVHGALRDEQGDRSFSRRALLGVLLFTAVVGWADVFTPREVPDTLYTLLGSVIIALCAWAGGKAAMRYLGPQVSGVASGIAAAAGRRERTDNRFTDDEQ